jgi:hypothetical protein
MYPMELDHGMAAVDSTHVLWTCAHRNKEGPSLDFL